MTPGIYTVNIRQNCRFQNSEKRAIESHPSSLSVSVDPPEKIFVLSSLPLRFLSHLIVGNTSPPMMVL
jgi:hypothetical protein